MATDRSRPRGPRAALATALLLATPVLVSACSGDDPRAPAEIRRATLAHRLDATFSAAQADCILGRLDAATIRALVPRTDQPTVAGTASLGAAATADWSDAVLACVTAPDADGTPSTTSTTRPGG